MFKPKKLMKMQYFLRSNHKNLQRLTFFQKKNAIY